MHPLMFSKAWRSKGLTLSSTTRMGFSWLFLLSQYGWGLMLGRGDEASTSASHTVCAHHPPGGLVNMWEVRGGA